MALKETMPVTLTKLTLEGFKSFAEPTDIVFDAPIVAIVGPNGSGKSNIAEALRFALGEQSMRALRGGRGEDVIFNGAPARARANRARVEVTLDNTKRIFPLDADEVRIARTVVRDGQQTYEINGSKVRLRDVQELIAHGNLGPSTYHIISQGEADRLLALSPVELRCAVEDALGLRLYHTRRAQALVKMADSRETLREAQGRQAELAPRVAALERQLAKVRKGQELAQALAEAWREYARRFRGFFQAKRSQIEEARVRLAAELEVAREQSASYVRDGAPDPATVLEDAREQLRRAREVYRSVEQEVRQLGERLARAKGARDAWEHMRSAYAKEGNISLPQRILRDLLAALTQARSFLASGNHDKAAELLRSVEAAVSSLLSTPNEEENNDAEATRDLQRLEEEIHLLEEELTSSQTRLEGAREELARSEESYEAAQAALREYEKATHQAREAQTAYTFSLQALQEQEKTIEEARALFEEDAREVAALLRDPSLLECSLEEHQHDKAAQGGEEAVWDEASLSRYRRDIERMKLRLEDLSRIPAQDIEREYEELSDRLERLTRDISDSQTALANLEAMVREIDKDLSERFAAGIEKVSRAFDEMVRTIFGQGSGSLEVIVAQRDNASEDAPEEDEGATPRSAATARLGVVIRVTLPKKRITSLGMLSGGERSLTAAALVFALSSINPPPFLVLDETDAALDEANSQRYGALLERVATSTQLIVITHNRETMRHAERLYGVAMGPDGVSRLLSVRLQEAAAS